MVQATIILSSLVIAFLIDRAVADCRPGLFRPIVLAVGAAMFAPAVIYAAGYLVRGGDGFGARFTAFAVGEVLLGYMFASGSWALRVLASARAGVR